MSIIKTQIIKSKLPLSEPKLKPTLKTVFKSKKTKEFSENPESPLQISKVNKQIKTVLKTQPKMTYKKVTKEKTLQSQFLTKKQETPLIPKKDLPLPVSPLKCLPLIPKKHVPLPIGVLKCLNKALSQELKKKVVAVIITISSGHSYDQLFHRVEQKAMGDTKALTFACPASYTPKLVKAFEGSPQDQEAKEMMRFISTLHHECVVLNWECSQGYAEKHFTEGSYSVFRLVSLVLQRKHMVMFSDFSLKALINKWKDGVLGPNPFSQVGQTNGQVMIHFNPKDLKQSPSAQLQSVGEMANQGHVKVHCMNQTITYNVNSEINTQGKYKIKVLTTVTKIVKGIQRKNTGHVLLSFAEGGYLLTSMGHWVDLMKIDISEQKLFQYADNECDKGEITEMKKEYSKLKTQEKKSGYRKSKFKTFVQRQAPCKNMKRKRKYEGYGYDDDDLDCA